MKKILTIIFALLLLPNVAFAQFTVKQGGTGTSSIPTGWIPYGSSNKLRIGASPNFFWDAVNSFLGIGTSTPYAPLSVLGQVVGSYFTATTSTASTFPYASTTAMSAQTVCLTSDTCRSTWPSGGGSAGTWSTTTSQVSGRLINYPNNNTDIVAIGANSTTTAKYWFDPNVNIFNNNGWNMGTTTAIVCKNSVECKYTSIQTALNDGWTNIYVKNGVYSEQVSFPADKVSINFESQNAIIQCNGATQSPCVTTNSKNEWKIFGGSIRETNAVSKGTAFDYSGSAKGLMFNTRINNFATSTYAHDSTDNTFYNKFLNIDMFEPISCIDIGGTQANENIFQNIQKCRPQAVDGGIAVYVSDGRGLVFDNVGVEGTTTSKANIGWYFDATSRDNLVKSTWTEAIGTGVNIVSGANNIYFNGGTVTSNGTDITDNGTNSSFIALNRTGTKVNQFIPFTVPNTTGTSSIVNALRIGNTAASRDNALQVDCSNRTWPASVTTGGCVNISNGTVNGGPALEVTSGFGAGATGRGVVFNQTNTAFDQDFILASSSAANTTALNVKGTPTGKGVVKIEHTGNGTGFSNGSMLSLDGLRASDAQGIFMDWTVTPTIGKLLNLRNGGNELLTLTGDGRLGVGTSSPYTALGVAGRVVADTFFATSTTATSTFANAISVSTTSSTFYSGAKLQLDNYGVLGNSYGMLGIHSVDPSAGNYDIRIDSPNPDIEFVELGQVSPAGKFEIAVNSNKLQLNQRRADDSSFSPGVVMSPLTGGYGSMLGIGTDFNNPGAVLAVVATSTKDSINVTSNSSHQAGSEVGDLFLVSQAGTTAIGSSSPYQGKLTVVTTGNSNILNLSQDNNNTTNYINLESTASSAGNNPCINWSNVAGAVNNGRICSTNGSSFTNSNMTFSVANALKAITERMRIDVNGNVGIGTTSPYARLSVLGEAVASYFTATTSTASTFPYASTTAISSSNLTSGNCVQASTGGLLTTTASPCGSGGGGSGGTWSTTTSQVSGQLVNYPNNTTDIVNIGSNSTTTGKFWFNPNNSIAYINGKLSLGSTTPTSGLSITDTAGQDSFTIGSSTSLTNGSIFVVDKYGRVGIGTNAGVPSEILHVYQKDPNSKYTLNLQRDQTMGNENFIRFTDSTNNGVYSNYIGSLRTSPSAAGSFVVGISDSIAAGVDNLRQQLVITAAGLFGYGTTTPWANFSIASPSQSTTRAFTISTSTATATSTAFVVDANGKVGIGTSTPFSDLTVQGTAVANNYNAMSTLSTSTFSGPATIRGYFQLGQTPTYPILPNYLADFTGNLNDFASLNVSNNNTGSNASADISWNNSNSTGSTYYSDCGQTSSTYNSTFYSTLIAFPNTFYCYNQDDRFVLYTASTTNPNAYLDFGTSNLSRMRILPNGNVGIGTTSPYTALGVAGRLIADSFFGTSTTQASTFNYASSTALGVSGTLYIPNGATTTVTTGGAIALDTTATSSGITYVDGGSNTRFITSMVYPSFTIMATSTAFTGTTTWQLGPTFYAETWLGAKCYTDVGSIITVFNNGTNLMNAFSASTTIGEMALTSNNVFASSTKRSVTIGTPASSPTTLTCTIRKTHILD